MKRYLELSAATSNKFWEIEVTGNSHRVSYGRIGTSGQRRQKTFDSAEAAKKDADRLLKSKLKKGYQQTQTIGARKAAKSATTKKATTRKGKVVRKKVSNEASARVLVDTEAILRWIGVVEANNANSPELDMAMIRKLAAKDIEPYFRPMRFLGWEGPEGEVSPRKKDWSNTFVFEVDGLDRPPQRWWMEELRDYLEPTGQFGVSPRVKELVTAQQQADKPTDDDVLRASALLAKTAVDAESIDLSKSWLKVIPDDIRRYKRAKELYCGDNKVRSLPAALFSLSQIETLYLGASKIATLPAGIAKLKRLCTLELDYCDHLTSLPKELGKLTSLRRLSLESTSNLTALPDEMSRLTNLEYLCLKSTELSGLPSWIGKLKKLTTLELSSGSKTFTLPASLGQLTNLRELTLLVPGETLPASITRLTNLQKLTLSGQLFDAESSRLRKALPGCVLKDNGAYRRSTGFSF